MYQSYYINKLRGSEYTKNGNEYPRFGVGGLRYRSQTSLSKLDSLNVGESIEINGDTIKRVK
ncbi:MAG: hypothetical protein E6R13_04480 [Spirochaetes bacterium]|nr:MAG: hypothetical protein E6R13_04480 [Spirochaetota bacterium]